MNSLLGRIHRKLSARVKLILGGEFFWVNPLFWPLMSFICTFIFVLILSRLNVVPSFIVSLVFLLVIFSPIGGLIANLTFYPINEKFLSRLILLYVSLTLIFANIYFLLMLFFDSGDRPFAGIHNVWTLLNPGGGRRIYLKDAILSFLDCLHFSNVTITTVGYGDMRPTTWYSKLISDIEIFMGLGVAVVGIGRYFSRNNSDDIIG